MSAQQEYDLRTAHWHDNPLKTICIPSHFIEGNTEAIVVVGNSMFPTMAEGSVIGYKQGVPFVSNEIYVVKPPRLFVKRVLYDHGRDGYILRSDNPDKSLYGDVFIPKDRAEHLIVGRVMWVWQDMLEGGAS